MEQYFLIVVAVGVVLTLFVLLKINKVNLLKIIFGKKEKKAKEKKEKNEKKDEVNFIPKESVEKPKIGHLSKIFSKKKEKQSFVKSSQPAKIADPDKVQKVTRSDFEKYEISIPKTSNLYSATEREKFIEEENLKNRPKGKGFSLGSKPKLSSPAPSAPIFDLPKTPAKDSGLGAKPSGALSDKKLDDFDFDFDDDFDDDLFGDDFFSSSNKPKPALAGASGSGIDDFDFDFDDDLDLGFGQTPSVADWRASGDDIFDRRKTQDKFSEVFGVGGLGSMAKEILLSNTVMEPAYKSRQRREADRKKRLGYM